MKLELMAPAGSMESFLSAFENGADSVYLGLQKFNARRPAGNFNFYQLKKAVEFAHSKGKKVYLALNIDLKSNELREAVEFVEYAGLNKIDGIIIKDPALLYIIKNFYNLDVHLSTQNAIESSFGIKFAKSQGVKRVVLARELELAEIAECGKDGEIEIEVFTEGSMCFSLSGRCLMSSWVGGRSGNRGCCTAPCRVLWQSGKKQANYFSMKDLNLAAMLGKLQNAGVRALKIEGRLKNAKWVGAITKIYRNVIDDLQIGKTGNNISNPVKLEEELKKYSARERSTGHIFGHKELTGANKEWEEFEKQSDPQPLKDITIFDEQNSLIIERETDYLHIKIIAGENEKTLTQKIPPEPKKGRRASINEISGDTGIANIAGRKFAVKFNCPEFHTTASFINSLQSDISKTVSSLVKNSGANIVLKQEIIDVITQINIDRKRNRILGDVPDKAIILPVQADIFLNNTFNIKTVTIILSGKIDIEKIIALNKKYKVIISLPPVIFEKDAGRISEMIKVLYNKGMREFEANSFTGIGLLQSRDVIKHLGSDMPVYNHISAKYFSKLGFVSVYCPVEGDASIYKSVSSFSDVNVECLVYGRIPLLISRVDSPDFKEGSEYSDKYCNLVCHKQDGINLFVEKTPLCLIGKTFKNENIPFDSLSCDLRFFNKPDEVLKNIFQYKLAGNSEFNFSRKLV